MMHPELGIYIGVPSYNRPQNVERMQQLLGSFISWYVRNEEQAEMYAKAGATRIVLPDGPIDPLGDLPRKRNQILRDAWAYNIPCLQVSDDLMSFERVLHGPNAQSGKDADVTKERTDFEWCIWHISRCMQVYPQFKLAGTMSTANKRYWGFDINTHLFIVADFILVKPCDLFHDERIKIKHDYDYTAQHIKRYGGVVRCDRIMAAFGHYTNSGGVVDLRRSTNREADTRDIAILKEKWPEWVRDHRTRELEVQFNAGSARKIYPPIKNAPE